MKRILTNHRTRNQAGRIPEKIESGASMRSAWSAGTLGGANYIFFDT
jgi:hypothetical protein